MSDSLTAIYVEQNQCPSHQSILLTQGRIREIFAKKFRELAILKNKLFFGGHFEFFFVSKNFFCFILRLKEQSFLASKVGSKFWWLPWFSAVFHSRQTFCTWVYQTEIWIPGQSHVENGQMTSKLDECIWQKYVILPKATSGTAKWHPS